MFLNLLIEVMLITILVGGAYFGYKRGFFRIAAKPARLVLCVMLSFSFCKVVGSQIVIPFIIARVDEGIRDFASPLVSAVSTAIAFLLLFMLTRLILSFVMSLASRFFDTGIIGRINRAVGFVIAGLLSLIVAMCFASLVNYLLDTSIFDNSDLAREFSGGPLYRLLLMISPIGL